VPLPPLQSRVLDLAAGEHVVTEPYPDGERAFRLPGSRSLVLVRRCSGLHCATKTRDHVTPFVSTDPGCGSPFNPRLVKMVAAADRRLAYLATFLDPEPSRGSVHDQRDVAPSLGHLEHSVVDAVAEQRALELPFALQCMYREKPANVAVTHAVTLARRRGRKMQLPAPPLHQRPRARGQVTGGLRRAHPARAQGAT
jgi:hypothetical protein